MIVQPRKRQASLWPDAVESTPSECVTTSTLKSMSTSVALIWRFRAFRDAARDGGRRSIGSD